MVLLCFHYCKLSRVNMRRNRNQTIWAAWAPSRLSPRGNAKFPLQLLLWAAAAKVLVLQGVCCLGWTWGNKGQSAKQTLAKIDHLWAKLLIPLGC